MRVCEDLYRFVVICGNLDSNKNFEGWQGFVGICVDEIE